MSRRFLYIFFLWTRSWCYCSSSFQQATKLSAASEANVTVPFDSYFYTCTYHTHPLHIDIMCMYIYISSNPNIHNPTYCFKKNNQPNQLLNYIITKMYRFMPFPFSKIHFFPASTSPGTHRVHPERSRSHRSLPRLFLDLGYHVGIGNP